MKKLLIILKDKRTQYCVIIWILLIKTVEIATSLISEIEFLRFLAVLGFESLSSAANLAWNGFVILTVLWLIYRLLTDVFNLSIVWQPLSRKGLFSLAILIIWTISAAVTALQFAVLATAPLANPELEVSRYYTPTYHIRNIEIFGWYWIDWGPNYYDVDFEMTKNMFIDGVFLLSDRYTFLTHPEAFTEAATIAHQHGLKVGIIVFHPYDADFQEAWNLPVNQGKFADFSTNKTWIEKTYTTKLRDLVSIGDSLNVTYYVYDHMNFDEAYNLTNAQLFIDVTYEVTHGKALMLGHYPPPKSMAILRLRIPHWDWYTAPEDVENMKISLEKKPSNNTSLGQFVWLYERTEIDFQHLQSVYNELFNADRIEIFALRLGAPSWTDGIANSILEHSTLVQHLTRLNLEVKGIENSTGSITFNDEGETNVILDLSRSVFTDPLSICEGGETLEYGTRYVGASYFTVKNSSLGQKIIEMRFCGNGSDGLQGWFAYRILLQNPLPINENATLMLLLKLTASTDGTAWTYIKMDFLSKGNETFTLFWKFHDVPMNYVFSSHNGTRNNYLIGSTTDWRFYQFDLNAVFYTSFSLNPSRITSLEYGIGAEADNDITAQFLVAKISPQPLEVNEVRVENVKPSIELKDDYTVRVRGLHTTKLFVILTPSLTEKNMNTRWSMLKISRSESYRWNTSSFSSMTEMKISFNVSNNSTRLLLNGKKITPKPQNQQPVVYKLDPKEVQVTLVVNNETNVYVLPVSLLIPILAFLFRAIRRIKILSKEFRFSK